MASHGPGGAEEPAKAILPAAGCATCPVHHAANLQALGVTMTDWDFVVALAGNPNTGKSTVFNALTGLRQHTGNWPGKTVTRAEGGFRYAEHRYKLVDLPGTYSLLASSPDEEAARDLILFGRPDVTLIVMDATRVERNLNLVLQVLEITDRVVVCLNLMDEARRHGLEVDERTLARELGVPVVPTSMRSRLGLDRLLQAVAEVATGRLVCRPRRIQNEAPELKASIATLTGRIGAALPALANARWVALRLLDGDDHIIQAMRQGTLGGASRPDEPAMSASQAGEIEQTLASARTIRSQLRVASHEQWVEAVYADAARIAEKAVTRPGSAARPSLDRTIDRLVTSRLTGFPIMFLLFASMLWLTISGANVPSAWLAWLLLDHVHPWLREAAAGLGMPVFLRGLLVDGMYLATAWVVSVMLPPMAIFFPLFTLLEDFGYLPRVAFNLDWLFKRAGAHGKQAMTTMMGFGCNAAGVIATRIIDSPRERLIAILTNNLALCNGRWPLQILIATLFIGAAVPAVLAGVVSALAVVGVALLGVALTFLSAWALSRTVLRGQVSTFSLELPPYRPPRILQTLYTSLIDRTILVLWRAVVWALPAGALIWLSANLTVGGRSIAEHLIAALDPLGLFVGLNGVILLAYVLAIPANEIVIPTILMLTVLASGQGGVGRGPGVMFGLEDPQGLMRLLHAGGWTLLTGVNLMLFSLLHNPCSTTIYTIYKETGSARWTAAATLAPLALGLMVTTLVALAWRLLGG